MSVRKIKKGHKYLWIVISLLVLITITALSFNKKPDEINYSPVSNKGKLWKIAYYEGGEYIDYASNMRAIAAALGTLGWIEPIKIPESYSDEDTSSIWQYLSDNAESDYIKFVPDAFYTSSWNDSERESISQNIIERLNNKADIDLIIAMGTWAGQDLVNSKHQTPTLALTSSAPIEAGILETYENSGYKHVLVEVDPERYRRQIRLFHDIVGFERLGVVYEDSEYGKLYSNIADLEIVAEERGFTIVRGYAGDYAHDEERSHQDVVKCYSNLAKQIDALWISAHIGEDPQYMPGSLEELFENNIPTWATIGPAAVKRGALLSIQYADSEAAGLWYAGLMARIFHGEEPGSINQVFEMPGQIVINLETARRIDFTIPEGVLTIADQLYNSITE